MYWLDKYQNIYIYILYVCVCTSWYIFYFIQFQILKKMVAVIQPINKHFIN